ncbi:MAG: ATP-binding protein [Caldilineaceae bacterium]
MSTDLTRQMLNAGRSSTDFQSIELNRLIQENVQFFSASIPKSVQLHAVQVQNLPYITGDAGQIQQLLMNLILNAADAIGEHAGTITVTTALHTLGASATGQWQWSGQVLDAGNYVALEVADTGCGMDSETLNKIFDPFFTTKFTGRGLGLASVLGIVRAHGGGLTVDSTPGIGTTFRILFPVATDGGFSVTEDVAVAMPSNSFKGTRVLIIDDERDVRQVTSEILEMSDIETLQAANGRIGLNLFQQYMDEIDLVLLDLSMPEMSGEEVAQALGHLKPDVNIILLSGYDEHEVSRRLGITHQISFLQKPYTMDGLLNAIQQQLAKTKSQPKVVAKKQAMPF